MKSKYKVLQCPCGCELPVYPKIEEIYGILKKHYSNNIRLVNGPNHEKAGFHTGHAIELKLRTVHVTRAQELLEAHTGLLVQSPDVQRTKKGLLISFPFKE